MEDVDLQRLQILVRGSTNKGRRGRGNRTEWIPLSRRSAFVRDQVKRAMEAGSLLLFPSPDDPAQPAHRTNLWRDFKRAAHKSGLGSPRFHDLRHVAHTRLKAAGLALIMRSVNEAARSVLGHESIEASEIYTHLSAEERRPVIDRLDSWLDERGGGPSPI